MKKLFNLLLSITLNSNIIFNLIACTPKIEDNQVNEDVDDSGRPLNLQRAKWYDFHKKIYKIIQDYYSVKNNVVYQLQEENKLLLSNSNILYWDKWQKLSKYKELQMEYNRLPNITNNLYEDDINKIFTTMRFGTIYAFFRHSAAISISNIFFHGDQWKENKLNIILNHIDLTAAFNINWEYKTRSKNLNDNWIETYNENTQIKLFQIIQYYKVTEKLYKNEIQKYFGKGYNLNNISYIRLSTDFKDYINMDKYQQWENENQNKPGYGVWKEIG